MKERPYPEGYVIGKEDWHFCQRLFERYGLILWYGELTAIRSKFRNRKGTLVRKIDEGQKVREVRDIRLVREYHEGLVSRTHEIRVVGVYDRMRREMGLVTVFARPQLQIRPVRKNRLLKVAAKK